jgi:hypothetical protein
LEKLAECLEVSLVDMVNLPPPEGEHLDTRGLLLEESLGLPASILREQIRVLREAHSAHLLRQERARGESRSLRTSAAAEASVPYPRKRRSASE